MPQDTEDNFLDNLNTVDNDDVKNNLVYEIGLVNGNNLIENNNDNKENVLLLPLKKELKINDKDWIEKNQFDSKYVKFANGKQFDRFEILKQIEELKLIENENKKIKEIEKDLDEYDTNSNKFLDKDYIDNFKKTFNEEISTKQIEFSNETQQNIFAYKILQKQLNEENKHIETLNLTIKEINGNKNISIETINQLNDVFYNKAIIDQKTDKDGNVRNIFTKINGLSYYSNDKNEWDNDIKKLKDSINDGVPNLDLLEDMTSKIDLKIKSIQNRKEYIKEVNSEVNSQLKNKQSNIPLNAFQKYEIEHYSFDQQSKKYIKTKTNLFDDLSNLEDEDTMRARINRILEENGNYLASNKSQWINDTRKKLQEEAQSKGKTFGDMSALDYMSFYKMGIYTTDTFQSLKSIGMYLKEKHRINSMGDEIFSKLREFRPDDKLLESSANKLNGTLQNIGIKNIGELNNKLIDFREIPGNENKTMEDYLKYLKLQNQEKSLGNNDLGLNDEEISAILYSFNNDTSKNELINDLKNNGFDVKDFENWGKENKKSINEYIKEKKLDQNEKTILDKYNKLNEVNIAGILYFSELDKTELEMRGIERDNIEMVSENFKDLSNKFDSPLFKNIKEKLKNNELTNVETKVFYDQINGFYDHTQEQKNKINQMIEYQENDIKILNNLQSFYKQSRIEESPQYKNDENILSIINGSASLEQKKQISDYLKIPLKEDNTFDVSINVLTMKETISKKDVLEKSLESSKNLMKDINIFDDKIKEFKILVNKEQNLVDSSIDRNIVNNKSLMSFQNNLEKTTNKPEMKIIDNEINKLNNVIPKLGKLDKNDPIVKTENYNDLNKTNKKLFDDVGQHLQKFKSDIDEDDTIPEEQKESKFVEGVEESFKSISKQSAMGHLLLANMKHMVKDQKITSQNIIDNFTKSAPIDFEKGLKNILNTLLNNKEGLNKVILEMQKNGELPPYVKPENLIGSGVNSDLLKRYEQSVKELNGYVEKHGLDYSVINVEEINKDLTKLNNFKTMDKNLEKLKENFLEMKIKDPNAPYNQGQDFSKEQKKNMESNYSKINDSFFDVKILEKKLKEEDMLRMQEELKKEKKEKEKEIQDIKEKEKKEHENDGSFNMDWKDR